RGPALTVSTAAAVPPCAPTAVPLPVVNVTARRPAARRTAEMAGAAVLGPTASPVTDDTSAGPGSASEPPAPDSGLAGTGPMVRLAGAGGCCGIWYCRVKPRRR